jgi:acetylornithine/N-succinyldiaminopimelate aminotransferase
VTVPASDVVGGAAEEGLLLCVAGEHTVRLLPPLIATREDLAQGLRIFERVLS